MTLQCLPANECGTFLSADLWRYKFAFGCKVNHFLHKHTQLLVGGQQYLPWISTKMIVLIKKNSLGECRLSDCANNKAATTAAAKSSAAAKDKKIPPQVMCRQNILILPITLNQNF